MTKRALCSGRIDKAANRQELSGLHVTVVDTIDPHFNASVLHGMSRELVGGDGDEGVRTYNDNGELW